MSVGDDNMPDFDSMSPEELMAWMETLAERQGATEGFTTESRVDIAEVDPNSVEVEDNYIPYGMNEEDWAKRKAEEEAAKAARLAERAATQGTEAPPTAPVEPAVVQPTAQTVPSGDADAPDFDSMSPEEMMRWMESLAKRQGVDSEQLTTTADMQISEVDESVAATIKDEYIPYGMTPEKWEEKKAQEAASKAQRAASQPQEAELPPMPEYTGEIPEPLSMDLPELANFEEETEIAASTEGGGLDWLNDLAADQGIGDLPDLSALGQEIGDLDLGDLGHLSLDDLEAMTEIEDVEPAISDPEAWLEGLASGGDEETAFELPIDDIAPEMPTAEPTPQPAAAGLSSPDEEDIDPLEWLESLAKRQGADSEEFITDAGLEVPEGEAAADVPGYTDYTFEDETMGENLEVPETSPIDALDSVSLSDPDDPVAWLDSLASSQGLESPAVTPSVPMFMDETEEELEEATEEEVEEQTEDIMNRLNRAESVSPEEMGSWMANLLEQGASRTDVPDYVEDEDEEDEEPIQAQIPDWLVDQVGPPPDFDAISSSEAQDAPPPQPVPELDLDLGEILDEGVAADEEMPDWLQPAPDSEAAQVEIPDWLRDEAPDDVLEDIFVPEQAEKPEPSTPPPTPEPAPASVTDEIAMDRDDPWVEAFELERTEGLQDTANVPDWYAARLSGESVPEEAEQPAAQAAPLQQASFQPETELDEGEQESVPDWIGEAMPMPVTERGPEAESWLQETEDTGEEVALPDWLQEQAEAEEAIEMPDWLKEANIDKTATVPDWLIDTIEEQEQPAFTPSASQEQAVVPAASSPAPVIPAAADIDLDTTLQSGREKLRDGDMDGGLQEYETIIRANLSLDVVVNDLSEQIKTRYSKSAAVYRVLGDGMMRQGRLQEALDTYRKALNLL